MENRILASPTLKDILLTTKDGDWGKDVPQEGFVPYRVIRGADFPDARIGNTKDIPLCYLKADTVHRRTLQPNDIIIETAGGNRDRPTGRTLLVKENLLAALDLPATCASFCRFLRVDTEKAVPAYVYWYLQYLYQKGEMWEHQVQHTGVARFQYTRFAESVRIPLPEAKEQQAIADNLDTLDDKIELNRRMNETLEAIGQALFNSWFVDFDPVRAKMEGREPFGMDADTAALFPSSFEESPLGLVPRGWNVERLSGIVEINPSRYLKREEPAPYLEMANMPTTSARALDWQYREFTSGMKFINGDVLVARITPCLENGKTAFVDFLSNGQVGWGSTEYLVFRSKPPLPLEYAYFLARTDGFRSFAIQSMTGSSGRQRVPAEAFNSFWAVAPPGEIAKKFGETASLIMAAMKRNDEESKTLAQARDALLPKLLSGELRIQDVERRMENQTGFDTFSAVED